MSHASIQGLGYCLPDRKVTNQELIQNHQLATTDAWVREKIGIHSRCWANPDQGVSDLALTATQMALDDANQSSKNIDCILFATETSEYRVPGSGVLLAQKLGLHHLPPAIDIRNASCGFVFGLVMACGLIESNTYRSVLLVASEIHSRVLDYSDRGRLMSVIFGDGAGAFYLEKSTDNQSLILGQSLHSNGEHYDKLWLEAPGNLHPTKAWSELIENGAVFPSMDGRFVFENAVKLMSEACLEALKQAGLDLNDIDYVIPHQANRRIIQAIQQKLNIPDEKLIINIENVANTSAASIPLAWSTAYHSQKIKPKSKVLIACFGAGFSWGALVINW